MYGGSSGLTTSASLQRRQELVQRHHRNLPGKLLLHPEQTRGYHFRCCCLWERVTATGSFSGNKTSHHGVWFAALHEELHDSAAPVEQKPISQTHESSSVGARPSSAAPVEQKPLSQTHESSS